MGQAHQDVLLDRYLKERDLYEKDSAGFDREFYDFDHTEVEKEI